MNLTFQEELKALLDLVQFKQFQRYGQTLFAKYDVLKPELTISELAWGFCRNPCFAIKLQNELDRLIPNCEQFSKLMAKANRLVENKYLNTTFDQAMRQVCSKTDRTLLAYSLESTNRLDRIEISADGTCTQFLHATDEDGELWHGLRVTDHSDWNKIDNIKISLLLQGECVWQHTFNRSNVMKHTKTIKDVTTFLPFSHPLILINLGLTVETIVNYECEPNIEIDQIFGIGSDEFCAWMSENAFELKLSNNNYALVDMPEKSISFRIPNVE